MRSLLLLPLLLSFSVPAIAHNEFNGGQLPGQGICAGCNGGGIQPTPPVSFDDIQEDAETVSESK